MQAVKGVNKVQFYIAELSVLSVSMWRVKVQRLFTKPLLGSEDILLSLAPWDSNNSKIF